MRSLLLLFACTLLTAVEVPAVPPLPGDELYAVVVVPDLRTALANQEQAIVASGTPLGAGTLALLLGAQFGDPGLANLQPGPVLLAVGKGVPMPSWCVIVPVADPAALTALAGGAGLLAGPVPGGLAIGSAPDGLALAQRLAPSAAALAKDLPAQTDLRAIVAGGRLARDYLPFVLGMMQMGMAQAAQMQPGNPAQQQRIAQIVAVALRVLATQAGSVRLDLGASAEGWHLDAVDAPAAGGHLATALRPLPPGGPDLGVRLGAGDGRPVIALRGRVPPAIYTALAGLLAEAGRDPAMAASGLEKFADLLHNFATATDGRLAMRQGEAGQPMRQLAVYGVRDAVALEAAFAQAFALLEGDGLLGFMRDFGIGMRVERAARRAGGVPVHRLTYTLDPSRLPPGQAEMMAAMLQPAELAVGREVAVFGAPPAAVDAVLAGPASVPLTLAAEGIGPGWDLYADYDLPLLMRHQFAAMRAHMPGMPAMFADEQGGNPLRFAAAFGDGRWGWRLHVPAALVKAMQQGFAGIGPQDPGAAPAGPPRF